MFVQVCRSTGFRSTGVSRQEHTCGVGSRAVAQPVAHHAGEVSADGRGGEEERLPVHGHTAQGCCHGSIVMEPGEAGLAAPGLSTEQGGVGSVHAHRHVMHRH